MAGDHARAESLLAHAVLLGVGLGVPSSLVLMLLIGPPLYRLLGGAGAPFGYAMTYSVILFCRRTPGVGGQLLRQRPARPGQYACCQPS